MYKQYEIHRDGAAMPRAATYRVDLPKAGLLSGLFLIFGGDEVSGYGANGGDWRLIDKITKIELVSDGSTPIFSMSGRAAQADAFYSTKQVAVDVIRNYASNTQFAYVPILFGRDFLDTDLMLDLSRFDNVELRITNDALTTEFSDTLSVSIVMIIWRNEGGIAPVGYLRKEMWQDWATVADETKYLVLPTENILRRIILQADSAVDANNIASTSFFNLMYDIEMSLFTGKLRVCKLSMSQLTRLNAIEYGYEALIGAKLYGNADKGYDIGIGYPIGLVGGAGAEDDAATTTVPTLSWQTSHTIKPETYVGDKPIYLMAKGLGYHNTAILRFDYKVDPHSWLDINANKQVLLNIKTRNSASAASGVNSVILDRLMLY